ncbi:thiamine diphosphokinase [Candidatus Woesearchaeota archaeon]|nr:MAG: thiamine diphosphokinase [Candidatus Woesearchaeota archaeon]
MNEAIIILNGTVNHESPFYNDLRKRAGKGNVYVVCADGGALNAALIGVEPDAIIGDLDSLPKDLEEKYADRIIRDSDQNTTDCDKAIRHCINKNAERITIIGACGTRWDHFIAAAMLLKKYAQVKIKIVDEYNELFLAGKETELDFPVGSSVSLIPLGRVEGLKLEGFKYDVENGILEDASRGIHNEITESPAKITYSKGALLVNRILELS